jgi:4-amino-4-deoxy-L-arabinose transferase-like glycosyltransferase
MSGAPDTLHRPAGSTLYATGAAVPLALRGWLGRADERDGMVLAALLALYCALMALIGLDRAYIGHHENDFVKFFIPEALRLLAGEPLLSRWHPPLYAIVLAGAYRLCGDWLVAGVLLSLASSVVVLAASYALFARLAGRAAAWGAVLTLLASGIFVEEAIRASSDAPFLALFIGACLLAVLAWSSGARLTWALCGVVVGLSLLTRSNAPPLLLLCLAPLVAGGPLRARLGQQAAVLGGLAVPLLAIAVFAAATGSHLLPSSNHINLAASYFAGGEDRASADAALAVAGRFDGVLDVLLHDPAAIARTYLLDLHRLAALELATLIETPLYLMFLPGLFFLCVAHASRPGLLLLLVMALELLMLNLKPFESRYYLFLIPLLGAAIGEMCLRILAFGATHGLRRPLAAVLVGMFAIGGAAAVARAWHITRVNVAELAEAVPLARQSIEPGALVIARKPNIGFYTAADWRFMPNLAGLDELRDDLARQDPDRALYLYYGQVEKAYRPQYGALADVRRAPPWLAPVAASTPPGAWALYRYRGPRAR